MLLTDLVKANAPEAVPWAEKVWDCVNNMFDKLAPETQNDLFRCHMLALDILMASMLGALKQTEPEDEDITNMSVWQTEWDFFNDMRNKLRLHCGVKQNDAV